MSYKKPERRYGRIESKGRILIAPDYVNFCRYKQEDILLPEKIVVHKSNDENRPAGFSILDWDYVFLRPGDEVEFTLIRQKAWMARDVLVVKKAPPTWQATESRDGNLPFGSRQNIQQNVTVNNPSFRFYHAVIILIVLAFLAFLIITGLMKS